jgi:hypothetical protein
LGVTSYHVRRLAALGFLKLVRKTPRRGAIEHYYTANSRPRVTDEAWAAVPPIVKRAMVDATLEHVGGHIRAAASDGGFDVADAHLTRSPVAVDETGWRSLSRELAALTERIRRIESESAERLAGSGHDGELQASVVLMLFQSAPVDSPRQPAAEHPRRRRTRRALKS